MGTTRARRLLGAIAHRIGVSFQLQIDGETIALQIVTRCLDHSLWLGTACASAGFRVGDNNELPVSRGAKWSTRHGVVSGEWVVSGS